MSGNLPLLLAAGTLAVLGLAHSVLGEVLVFRALRTRGWVPTGGRPLLGEPQVRILWGSWHLVTLLGWALSALLWHLGAAPADASPLAAWMADLAGLTTLASGLLVLFATRGRHPAWVVLLAVAALVWWR